MRGSKNDYTFFDGLDVLYHRAKFGEDRTTRAGCVGAKMWYLFFLCHAPCPARSSFEALDYRQSLFQCCCSHVPLGCAKFHVNRCNESPLRGENADVDLRVNLNTG